MTVSFIHAADLHLDSPLRGLAAYPEAPVDRIRGASRRAFSALIDAAIERRVNFIVLAGDVWDGDWPDIGTGLYFAREMGRLGQAGIRAFLIRGNHDAESQVTRTITLPENVHVFRADHPETVRLEEFGVALHGRSFPRPEVTENIAIGYPDAASDLINIGLLHTALEGDADHATYAPCRVADLQGKQYDYWALGHVHRHAVLANGRSAADGGTIAFSGVLQGRHARETGPCGALMVEIGSAGLRLERLVLDVVRWCEVDVDVSNADAMADVARRIGEAFRNLMATADPPARDRLVAVRLTMRGRTPLHGRLILERGQLRDEALGQAMATAPDAVFLEKIVLATEPVLDAGTVAIRRDALADLQEILERAHTDAELASEAEAHLAEFLSALPPDVRKALEGSAPDQFRAIAEGRLDRLVPANRAALIDFLARA